MWYQINLLIDKRTNLLEFQRLKIYSLVFSFFWSFSFIRLKIDISIHYFDSEQITGSVKIWWIPKYLCVCVYICVIAFVYCYLHSKNHLNIYKNVRHSHMRNWLFEVTMFAHVCVYIYDCQKEPPCV